jgi:hypothetical protein
MPPAEMVDTVLDSGRKVAMNISETRLVGVGIVVLSVIAPFVLWLAMYAAERWQSLDLHPLLPWVRRLHLLTLSLGVALYAGYLVIGDFHRPAIYPVAVLGFAMGLYFPANWLKRRAASNESSRILPL